MFPRLFRLNPPISYLNRPISCKMRRLLLLICEKVFTFASFDVDVDAGVYANLKTQKLTNLHI